MSLELFEALNRLTHYINGINEDGFSPSVSDWESANKQAQEALENYKANA